MNKLENCKSISDFVTEHSGAKQITLDSREVAKMIGKNHNHLARDIKNYITVLSANPKLDSLNFFLESEYIDAQGKPRPCYLITRKGCDMVANKLTGEKGILFTAKYVERFYEMEHQLKELPVSNDMEVAKIKAQQDRAKAMLLNAQSRALKTLMATIDDKKLSPIAVQVFGLKAIEQVTGEDMGQYLPQCEKTYSATEIGKKLGISANKVGSIANKHHLKTDEYGLTVMDKSRYSDKEVSSFRYYERVIPVIGKLI